jgi:hypothetical protein
MAVGLPCRLDDRHWGSFMSRLMTPGEVERDRDHKEQESITDNANNNTSPEFTHCPLLPLRRKGFCFLLF